MTDFGSLRFFDGKVLCCLCFTYKAKSELDPVKGEPGRYWDACTSCRRDELVMLLMRGYGWHG